MYVLRGCSSGWCGVQSWGLVLAIDCDQQQMQSRHRTTACNSNRKQQQQCCPTQLVALTQAAAAHSRLHTVLHCSWAQDGFGVLLQHIKSSFWGMGVGAVPTSSACACHVQCSSRRSWHCTPDWTPRMPIHALCLLLCCCCIILCPADRQRRDRGACKLSSSRCSSSGSSIKRSNFSSLCVVCFNGWAAAAAAVECHQPSL